MINLRNIGAEKPAREALNSSARAAAKGCDVMFKRVSV
jgi:hypothetical protein